MRTTIPADGLPMPDLWKAPLDRPLVIAHRGGAALAAENTIAAIRAAEAAGADAIETDIRATSDGALVCVHDADLLRLCNNPRAVADLDLTELRQVLPGVMTLAEALGATGTIGILLDFKLADESALLDVIDEIERSPVSRNALLGLRSLPLICAARSRSHLPILAFLDSEDLIDDAVAAGANWFRLWQGWTSRDSVSAVQGAGMHAAIMVGQPRSVPLPEYPPFPVGVVDAAGLARIAQTRPDAILLDDPRLLRAPASPVAL
ncbi:glycerophosphodiester phosphodiesterase family protein [Rhizobium sp. S152]|uniref:glycerophosphodiester phosphodiesterase n=1 Tax=Rhizobium sp. S152 TaxID=3055038 RepID=UPI0025A97640|nr:glycerophosphodiester phosphodiesterase family protein [Rhizobium sp. S152]MDM9627268.1 glycerophosphodiester phosphodiesterase family protein [Rhizobium sp. S152]